MFWQAEFLLVQCQSKKICWLALQILSFSTYDSLNLLTYQKSGIDYEKCLIHRSDEKNDWRQPNIESQRKQVQLPWTLGI